MTVQRETTDGPAAPDRPEGRPAQARLVRLMDGYLTTQLLHVAAALGVADVLADGRRSAEEVAAAVGVPADRLRRVLRGLVLDDVLAEDAHGRFALTDVGAWLRADVPGSLRGPALARGTLYHHAAAGLLDAVARGGTPFERAYGRSFFDHLASDPAAEAGFNASMAARAAREAVDVLGAYDFAGIGRLVDVGGGAGILLTAILRAAPALTAVLVDRAAAVAEARRRLDEAGVGDRAECVAGDFFAALPTGADAYVLSRILHDWEDADAARILRVCGAAMAPGTRLIVVEALLPERAVDGPEAVRMDLHMLILLGARERTEAEYRALLAGAGFEVRRVVPTASPAGLSVIEAVRA